MDEQCARCQHPFDPHTMVATTGDPVDGGIVLCPVKDCECYATWGVQGGPAKLIPEPEEISEIRLTVQGATS